MSKVFGDNRYFSASTDATYCFDYKMTVPVKKNQIC